MEKHIGKNDFVVVIKEEVLDVYQLNTSQTEIFSIQRLDKAPDEMIKAVRFAIAADKAKHISN